MRLIKTICSTVFHHDFIIDNPYTFLKNVPVQCSYVKKF